MASVLSCSVEWYQSESVVTASLSLKGVSRGETVTPKFSSQHCAIYVGDKVYWETSLANCIVPDKCTLKIGRVRAELKLKKTDPIQWSDFEAPAPVVTGSTTKPDNLSKKTAHLPSSSPSNSPPSSTPARTSTRKPFLPVQNDFVYLNYLRHDCIDKGEDEVRVKVIIGGVKSETCSVDFKEGQLELLFQTSDKKFLSSYTGSSQTTFVWKVQLYGTIVPDASHYQVIPTGINIVLKKAFRLKWKALERSKHQSSLNNSSLNSTATNCFTENDASADRKASLGSNSNDSEMNDFDAVDDYTTPTPPQVLANGPVSFPTATTTPGQVNSGCDKYTPTSPGVGETYTAGGGPVKNYHMNPLPTSSNTVQTYATSLHSTSSHVAPSEMEVSDPNYRYEQLRRPSETGLINPGNTCFMNSILQCLSNTQDLRDYFVSGRYLANINPDNPLGFEGKLAKCFSVILRKLWSGEYKYFSPKKLMEIVAKRSKNFDGNSQHDAHEFMSYLVDGLHEDLNRVRKKPATKPVEMENHPDREVAAESWRVHKMRNDSMMVDLFQGQFKSTLVCQDCNKESVTFDPFLSLSVPIPRNLRRLPVIFVPQDPYTTPRRLILQLPPEATLKLLKASVARRTSLSLAQLRVFEVYKGKFQSLMSDNRQPIAGIKASDIIIVSEVLSERSVKGRGPIVEVNVVQRVQIAPFPTKCGFCGCVAEEGRKLLRCGKCRSIGYCHRKCQEKDWKEHRLKCGKAKPSPVGLPFVISLPARELTFSKLTEYAEKFASRSVTVNRRHSVPKPLPVKSEALDGNSDESMQESAMSIQTSNESMQESAMSIQTSNKNIQESTMSIQTSDSMQESAMSIQTSDSMQESAMSIQTSVVNMHESAVNTRAKPMYTLIRVNRFVEPISGESPLEDGGESPLVFDDDKVYLAMDWRNDPREKDSVVATPKATVEYVEEEKEAAATSSDTVSLTQCLQLFTEPETLSKDEAWYCPRCKEHRQAIKQMSVWRLPRFLVIHLKRFSFHNFVWRSKIDHLVSFPLHGLDMSPYLLGDAANDIPSETPPIYDLYGTVNHYGNIYIGHYVANVKPPLSQESRGKEWLCYDDHNVGKITGDKVQCSEAYVLFYRRRDMTSSP